MQLLLDDDADEAALNAEATAIGTAIDAIVQRQLLMVCSF